MDDLGPRSSYLAVRKGVPVFASDGEELGRLDEILKDPEADMFDGVIFDGRLGPGGLRFVDAPEVGEIYEQGIVLKIDAAAAAKLPAPAANPATMEVDADDLTDEEPTLLERAWNFLSGKGNS